MTTLEAVALVVVGVCSAWTLLGTVAVLRATRQRPKASSQVDAADGVSVLKPLCGSDSELESNLQSFFEQDHASFELLFGIQNPDDPAILVVERLMRRYPHVNARLIQHEGVGAMNPKVDNLLGLLPEARHELVLISDSNVHAPHHYVREMVQEMQRPNTGLVTNLFAGTGEDGLGSALENVQLNGFCAAGAALPTLLGDALVVGKSMLLSRRVLAQLGGLSRVKDVLAEDFVLGKLIQHAGLKVRIAPTVLSNVTRAMPFIGFVRRQQRWAMLRFRLRPAAQLAEVLTSPLAMLPFAWVLMGPVALTWCLALVALRDVGGWVALRGFSRAWIPTLLAPLRELSILAVWLRAPLKRHVTWRGHRVRLGAGTLVYAPVLPKR